MDYNTIYQEVLNLTNRPDLTNETRLAIQKTTMQLHQMDFWYKDLFEDVIANLPTDVYTYSLDIPSNFTRFRAFNYIRMLDPSNVPVAELELVSPKDIFDYYHKEKTNVFYVGGQSLNVRVNLPYPAMIVGYYQYPDVTVDTTGTGTTSYNTWIAQENPYAIIEGAAANLFKTIGYADSANFYQQNFMEHVQMLKQANILEQVR